MTIIARTRAEVDLRAGPKAGTSIVDRLSGDCPVDILEDLNRWYKVSPSGMLHGVSGYVPQAALTFQPGQKLPVFPTLPITADRNQRSLVPQSVTVTEFLRWLDIGGKPDWIPDQLWSRLGTTLSADFQEKIRAASIKIQPRWDTWLADLRANSRLEEAVMNEWVVMMEGGREVYAIRDHYVYMQPAPDSGAYGNALKGQILRWNGNVRSSDKGGKHRSYYEVDFFRLSRTMHGWFRADVAADFIFPQPDNDPAIESNAQKVFDLSNPFMRYPQDHEMEEARQRGYFAAQYIDVYEATKRHLVHFSLCGEFCVAALSGKDIVPTLRTWLDSKYTRAPSILGNPHEGTSVGDLQTLLAANGLKGEIYKSIPTTPEAIKERLSAGQRVIVGCGINSTGRVKPGGKIRHWVVLEDLIPSGTSGWARVYNPFQNREEVYNYGVLMASAGAGAGLWITPSN